MSRGYVGCLQVGKSNFMIHNIEKMSDRLNGGTDLTTCFYYYNPFYIRTRGLNITAVSDWIIVLNGIINNKASVKYELKCRNQTFNMDSDYEYILAGFLIDGIRFFNKLNGFFSLILFNKKDKVVYAASDHVNSTPIYYTLFNNACFFSTEIKALVVAEGFQRRVNEYAVLSYLSYRYAVGEETFYQNIFRVPASTVMMIKNGEITCSKYEDDSLPSDTWDKGYNYYFDELQRLLSSCVSRSSYETKRQGLLLSGGIDSSLIAAYAADKIDECYIMEYMESGYSETQYAKQVADKYGLQLQVLSMSSKEYFSLLDKAIEQRDQPLSIPHEVAFYQLFKTMSHQGITSVICGEGSDEHFGGYGRIMQSHIDFKKIYVINHTQNVLCQKLLQVLFFEKNYREKKLKDLLFQNDFLKFFLANYRWFSQKEQLQLLSNHMQSTCKKYDEDLVFDIYYKIKDQCYENQILYLFQKIHLPNLLERLYSVSTCFNIQVQLPFLDKELIRFCNQLPVCYKNQFKTLIHRAFSMFSSSSSFSENLDIPKYILKKVAERQYPKSLVYRKKMGFPVPLNKWMKMNIELVKEAILDRNSFCLSLFQKEPLENYINNYDEAEQFEMYGKRIWMLYNLELWYYHMKG